MDGFGMIREDDCGQLELKEEEISLSYSNDPIFRISEKKKRKPSWQMNDYERAIYILGVMRGETANIERLIAIDMAIDALKEQESRGGKK